MRNADTILGVIREHGRPRLGQITRGWKGVKWCIEGDVSQCCDSIDHPVLLTILRESYHDQRFLRLIANLLKAGYLEEWRYHTTLSVVPQGGGVSPILSNLYLDRIDRFVETVLLPAYHYGKRSRPYPPYIALLKGARNSWMAGKLRVAKVLRRQAQRLPSRDPTDPHFRRLWYVRYAGEWLLGFSGPREEAETIKGQLGEFLRETLHLTLSHAQTLITNARTEAARFLGYEIANQHADATHPRALPRRCINGAPGLKVPVHIIRAKCTQYRRRGKPIPLAARLHDTDYSIVAQHQAEYRGFVQYYLRAYNLHRLGRVHWVMPLSLVKPLVNKRRMSVNRIYRKYRSIVPTPHGTLTVLEVQHARGQGKKPLVARAGGIELRWQKQALLNDQRKEVFGTRSEVVQRLLAQDCQRCGAMAKCEVHHIRKLADLSRAGQREKPLWVRRMAARRRKTLVVCQPCHEDMHRERPPRRKITA